MIEFLVRTSGRRSHQLCACVCGNRLQVHMLSKRRRSSDVGSTHCCCCCCRELLAKAAGECICIHLAKDQLAPSAQLVTSDNRRPPTVRACACDTSAFKETESLFLFKQTHDDNAETMTPARCVFDNFCCARCHPALMSNAVRPNEATNEERDGSQSRERNICSRCQPNKL